METVREFILGIAGTAALVSLLAYLSRGRESRVAQWALAIAVIGGVTYLAFCVCGWMGWASWLGWAVLVASVLIALLLRTIVNEESPCQFDGAGPEGGMGQGGEY